MVSSELQYTVRDFVIGVSEWLQWPTKAPWESRKERRRKVDAEGKDKVEDTDKRTDISHPLPWSTECVLTSLTDAAASGCRVRRCGIDAVCKWEHVHRKS